MDFSPSWNDSFASASFWLRNLTTSSLFPHFDSISALSQYVSFQMFCDGSFFLCLIAVCRHAVNVANCNPVFGSYAPPKSNEECKSHKKHTQTIDSFHSIRESMVFGVAIETMHAKWRLYTRRIPFHCVKKGRRISWLNLDEFLFHLVSFVCVCVDCIPFSGILVVS